MLTRLYADNYRCFSSFELALEPLSVLTGANGSGKSTLLSLFSKLRDLIAGDGTTVELFPVDTLTRWDRRDEQTFELAVKLEYGQYLYRLRLNHDRERALNKIVEETLTLDCKPLYAADDREITLFNDAHGGGVKLMPDWHISGLSRVQERHDNKKLQAFRRCIEGALVLALNPALVSAVSAEKQPVTTPRPDCSNFAGWLKYISAAETLASREAERSLGNGALPGFFAVQPEPSGDATLLQCVFKTGAVRAKFRLDELSYGQIALVILEHALAVMAERGGLLMLDEPANFLGLPEIQPLLVRVQDAALEGRYQAILTSHHPVAVDFLAGNHGVWLEREPTGATRAKRIQVAAEVLAEKEGIRVSDLVARGWLSGLGVGAAGPANDL